MDLADIAGIGDQKEQLPLYKAALDEAVAAGDAAALRRFVDHGAASAGSGACPGR